MCCQTKSDKSDSSDGSDGSDGSGAKKAAPGGRSLVYVAVWGSVGEFVGYGVAVVEDYVEQIHAFGLC